MRSIKCSHFTRSSFLRVLKYDKRNYFIAHLMRLITLFFIVMRIMYMKIEEKYLNPVICYAIVDNIST